MVARKPSVTQPCVAPGGGSIGRILGKFTNCTIGNLCVNVNAPMQQSREEESDDVTRDIDLDLH